MDVRARFASDLCQHLEAAGISFGIIHGAEDFPNSVGRDFDILIHEDAIARAVGLVCDKAARLGWQFLQAPIFWAGAPVVFWKSATDELCTFEMHFITRLVWGGCILATIGKDDIYRDQANGLPLARRAHFAKRILTQVLAGCWDRMAARPREFLLLDGEEAEARRLSDRLFGRHLSGLLIGAMDAPDLQTLRMLAPRLRRALVLRAAWPFTSVRPAFEWFVGKACRITGWVRWRLPNLVVSSASIARSQALMDKVIQQLGFTQAMVLSPVAGTGLIDRLRERIAVRIHRGLFRFAALGCTSTMIDRIDSRLGSGHQGSGTLVIDITEDGADPLLQAVLSLGSERRTVTCQASDSRVAVMIACLFMRAAKATCCGIDFFTGD